MKTIEEIAQAGKEKTSKQAEMDDLASKLARANTPHTKAILNALETINKNWSEIADDQKSQLAEVIESIVDNIPKPEMAINFNGLKSLKLDSVEVVGLNEALAGAFSKLESSMKTLCAEISMHTVAVEKAISNIKVAAPEITIPPINIPKVEMPKITVPQPIINVPQPKVTVNVPEQPEQKQKEIPLNIDIKKDKFGRIVNIIEKYGSGKITYTRTEAGGWDIDDRRK